MDLGLANAAAVVVGGSRGIGLATAGCLAAEGARVGIVGRNASKLHEAARLVMDAGSPDVLELRSDVDSASDVDAFVTRVRACWGQLNILINAVGPGAVGGFEALDDTDWAAAFDRGTMSAVRCVRAALPLLRDAEWARVVNVTAMSVQHQQPFLVSYTAAKSALLSVTKNLARALAPHGILVNAVAPGPILTDWARPILDQAGVEEGDAVAAYQHLARDNALAVDLCRVGRPEEVAAVIAFCASRRNTFMTGAHLNVDGGSDFV
jgi:NAD(P)-dependent dehydrogenase (short-subunit alcohol dehydrogenase family)